MNAKQTPPRLGRGLAALFGEMPASSGADAAADDIRRLPIDLLDPSPFQPRMNFDEDMLRDLAESIRTQGVLQPILVRPHPDVAARYQIIAGERRWRAAQRAGLHVVPIVPLDVSDDEALQLAIIENVQRSDLNPLEEAAGYQALVNEFQHSQDAIAKMVGKSRSHVANTLRLLKLPQSVQDYIGAGKISAGHARMLVGQPDPERLAREIMDRGLNVRQVEALAQERAQASGKSIKSRQRVSKDADTAALERRLSDALGLTVAIDHRGQGGVLTIRYRDVEQLDEVIRRLETP
jgi:ParB family chromosome partitioning protein